MTPVFIAALFGIAAYIGIVALMPASMLKQTSSYTRGMLQKLENDDRPAQQDEDISVLRQNAAPESAMARAFMAMPGSDKVHPYLLKGGMGERVGGFFSAWLGLLILWLYLFQNLGILGLIMAIGLNFVLGRWYILRQITKRNNAFVNYFPDALDMIVRSVRSGYPLNSSIRMIADNMQPPVSTEFKQMADEIAFGSTLIEALQRMSKRIDEPDVHFFVIVLSVQQDVGGNLSEVLQNLSTLIRKRKYMRLKVQALASEGKATAWVLGSMPFAEAILLQFMVPDHLTPLYTTHTGQMVMGATLCVVAMGLLIIKKIINIKV